MLDVVWSGMGCVWPGMGCVGWDLRGWLRWAGVAGRGMARAGQRGAAAVVAGGHGNDVPKACAFG